MISVLEFRTDYSTGKAVDMVLIAPKGEGHMKTQTWRRVLKLKPPETNDPSVKESASYIDMAAKWSIIGPAYNAWKEGNTLPEDGTPLAVWPGVNQDMARALVSMGLRTVEDVRDMGDGAVSRLPFPNARKLPELAAKFLEGKDKAASDKENAELRERLAAMEELLNERLAEDKPQSEDKPKRGRPKKEAEAV